MTEKRTRVVTVSASARLQIARAEIATVFHSTLTETVTSHEEAARAIGVHKRTVGAWLRKERALDLESVLATPRLERTFRRLLCAEHHEPLPGYIAKKRGSK